MKRIEMPQIEQRYAAISGVRKLLQKFYTQAS